MRKAESNSSPSDVCKPLLESATVHLYRQNAFRVLGLEVNATARTISKIGARMKMVEELGMGAEIRRAFPLHPPPNNDEIRASIQRLQDPEKRAVDEFFWFWPQTFAESQTDPALQALTAGDVPQALQLWTAQQSAPLSQAAIAQHNLAILWHLTALEFETQASPEVRRSEDWQTKAMGFWKDSLTRWESLIDCEQFWEIFRERLRQIDDPRLTQGFASRFRSSFPTSLGLINGALALQYLAGNEPDLARLHARWIGGANGKSPHADKIAQLIVASLGNRVNEQIKRAAHCRAANPAEGTKRVAELVDEALRVQPSFDLFFEPDNRFRTELFNEVADSANKLAVAYHKATRDCGGAASMLKAAQPFASLEALKTQIQKNIDLLAPQSTPVNKGSESPFVQPARKAREGPGQELRQVLLRRFGVETVEEVVAQFQKQLAEPMVSREKLSWLKVLLGKLDGALSELPEDSNAAERLNAMVCQMMREISLKAAFDELDFPTAIQANDFAFRYARTPAEISVLKKDRENFGKLSGRAPKPPTSHPPASKPASPKKDPIPPKIDPEQARRVREQADRFAKARRVNNIAQPRRLSETQKSTLLKMVGTGVAIVVVFAVAGPRRQNKYVAPPPPPLSTNRLTSINQPDETAKIRQTILQMRSNIVELQKEERAIAIALQRTIPPLAPDPELTQKLQDLQLQRRQLEQRYQELSNQYYWRAKREESVGR